MNIIDIGFSIIVMIAAITRETCTIRRSSNDKNTNNNFANLLNSLVRVNEGRMDALNKFFKLNNLHAANTILRTSGDKEGPNVAVLFVDQDEGPGLINKLSAARFGSDSDSDSSREYDDYRSEKKMFSNLRMSGKVADKSSSESGHEVVSTENKEPLKNDQLISDPESSSEWKLGTTKQPARLLGSCIQSTRSYLYCKAACKEAYRRSCYYYSCSSSLYRQLRKECSRACSRRFRYA